MKFPSEFLRLLKVLEKFDDRIGYGMIFIERDGKTVGVFIDDSDFFAWGYAGAFPFPLENSEIDLLEKCYEEIQAMDDCLVHYAPLLHCARKNGMRPQGAAYHRSAKEIWHLFDACGPERETGIGNPSKPGEPIHVSELKEERK